MVIAIIGILTAIMLGASVMVRNSARRAQTQATIAKLNNIIMERWESYQTRRLPINTAGFPPQVAAQYRLFAIRDLMRMEMPDRPSDCIGSTAYPSASDAPQNIPLETPVGAVTPPPYSSPVQSWTWPSNYSLTPPGAGNPDNWQVTVSLPTGTTTLAIPKKLPAPALATVYWNIFHTAPVVVAPSAACLYAIVSQSNPQALEQFTQEEIGTTPVQDSSGNTIGTLPVFIDGWGRPILWMRYPAGYSSGPPYNGPSEIQTGDPVKDHDPFDSLQTESAAFRLVPLIYSVGPDGVEGIVEGPKTPIPPPPPPSPQPYEWSTTGPYWSSPSASPNAYTGDPYWSYQQSGVTLYRGSIDPDHPTAVYDNIDNHHIETQ